MTYRRFVLAKTDRGRATPATTATFEHRSGESVATVAGVAEVHPKSGLQTVADVAGVAGLHQNSADAVDLAMEAEERAGILEYDASLPRMEAMRLAFGRPPTPGITVRAPAVELSAADYDAHLDALIMAVAANTPEASRIAYAKRKGWVVPRGDETVFTRGR